MRIAYRQPDGSWLFSSPDDPFKPVIHSNIDIERQLYKVDGRHKDCSSLLTNPPEVIAVPPPAYCEVEY